jgi:hypothetical protein
MSEKKKPLTEKEKEIQNKKYNQKLRKDLYEIMDDDNFTEKEKRMKMMKHLYKIGAFQYSVQRGDNIYNYVNNYIKWYEEEKNPTKNNQSVFPQKVQHEIQETNKNIIIHIHNYYS